MAKSLDYSNDVEEINNPQETKENSATTTKKDENSLDNFETNSSEKKPNETCLQNSEKSKGNSATKVTPNELEKAEESNEIAEEFLQSIVGGMLNKENESLSTSTKIFKCFIYGFRSFFH